MICEKCHHEVRLGGTPPCNCPVTDAKPRLQRLVSSLLAKGWAEYPDAFRKTARCIYKRYATPTPARCNNEREGIQVCISLSQHAGRVSIEIDLSGELPDYTWIRLSNYSLGDDLDYALAAIPRLLQAWEAMASAHTPDTNL